MVQVCARCWCVLGGLELKLFANPPSRIRLHYSSSSGLYCCQHYFSFFAFEMTVLLQKRNLAAPVQVGRWDWDWELCVERLILSPLYSS